MRNVFLLLFLGGFLSAPAETKSTRYSEPQYAQMLKDIEFSHDLSLPAWGPYTKNYIGLSHIPDVRKGIRFDISVFPGFYRRKVDVPNVFFESGYHPWEASPDLAYFSFRHELEWKDQVYTDISYSNIDDQARLIRIECVNNTDLAQSVVLHYMASAHFPSLKEYAPDTPLLPARVALPAGALWIDALDYQDLVFARPRPQDRLVYDGKLRGEIRQNGFVQGSGIGQGFALDRGDAVSYVLDVRADMSQAVLIFRYRMQPDAVLSLKCTGLIDREITLHGTGDLTTFACLLGDVARGSHELLLTSLGGAELELDGFVLANKTDAAGLAFEQVKWNAKPQILDGPQANSLLLKYEQIDSYYGIKWFYESFQVRQFIGCDLDVYFRTMANNHVQTVFRGEGDGHYTNIFLRPIKLEPHAGKVLYGLVCNGTREQVVQRLQQASESSGYEKIYQQARQHLTDLAPTPAGRSFTFSQERLTATLLCNVVYPVYTQHQYIRHSAPGRWWDCLYTWDSGFIGLGLLELDEQRAVENLNAYVQEPGAQSAFIHHGSMVPVQHYLFLELWNRTQSKELLKYFYPRLKQYYAFYTGSTPGSTTRVLPSNLLKTWDYFYNSGGWDDLPPQKFTHDHGLEAKVAPVVSSAHGIRIAKILQMAAQELGLSADVKAYDKDIKMFTTAIQKYAWDPETGYFGYVVHDDQGRPKELLRAENGENLDKGLDGAYPLFAGICTAEQKARILEHLKNEREIWSSVGLSAVDQTASYYKTDGYWNGAVWMPHQWFFWKTMLDLGEAEFAHKIARTALETWKRETGATYNSMEHFVIETGRGAGWHEFGGLSAPVLIWYSAYYRPGTLSTGLNTWVASKEFSQENRELKALLRLRNDQQSEKCSLVVCMNPDSEYQVSWNDKALPAQTLHDGCLSVDLPLNKTTGLLRITLK